jgi:hypothetical protein
MDGKWKNIPGFPRYQASEAGEVRSIATGAWRVLRQTPHSKTGYAAVTLRVHGRSITRSVHRLIALTFLGDPADKDVNHKNGDKQDNRIVNLEYLSRGDNHRHAYRTGLREPVGAILTDEQRAEISEMAGKVYQDEIARLYGVSTATVKSVIHQRRRRNSQGQNLQEISA